MQAFVMSTRSCISTKHIRTSISFLFHFTNGIERKIPLDQCYAHMKEERKLNNISYNQERKILYDKIVYEMINGKRELTSCPIIRMIDNLGLVRRKMISKRLSKRIKNGETSFLEWPSLIHKQFFTLLFEENGVLLYKRLTKKTTL